MNDYSTRRQNRLTWQPESSSRWSIIETVGRGKVRARCACGVERTISTHDIKSGKSRSCGCLRREGRWSSVLDRLADLVAIADDGCWYWIGTLDAKGYGHTIIRGRRTRLAHRIAYEELVGPIPNGLTLDHLCRNRACVNPDHLEPVTQGENNARSESITARLARKTHCIRGHEFTPENTHVGKKGNRTCRACGALRARNRRAGRRSVV